MSRVNAVTAGMERANLLAFYERIGVTFADPVPFAVFPNEADVDDQCWVTPDAADHDDLVDSTLSIIARCRGTYPGRRHWSRWRLTRRAASRLYVLGITSNGGSYGMDGNDPIGTTDCTFPRFDRRMRPYILGRQRWWWDCHINQGWRLRGRHWPAPPYIAGVCAKCLPCATCGAIYECVEEHV